MARRSDFMTYWRLLCLRRDRLVAAVQLMTLTATTTIEPRVPPPKLADSARRMQKCALDVVGRSDRAKQEVGGSGAKNFNDERERGQRMQFYDECHAAIHVIHPPQRHRRRCRCQSISCRDFRFITICLGSVEATNGRRCISLPGVHHYRIFDFLEC